MPLVTRAAAYGLDDHAAALGFEGANGRAGQQPECRINVRELRRIPRATVGTARSPAPGPLLLGAGLKIPSRYQ